MIANLKNKKIHGCICLIIFLNTACKKDVTSCFEPDAYKKKVGETFKFSNCSDNFERCEWDFGDGSSSEISEPSHVYDKLGSFEVQLTTYRKKKSSEQKKWVIAANEVILSTTLTYSNRIFDDGTCIGAISWARAGENNFTQHSDFQSNGFDRPGVLEVPVPDANTSYRLKLVYTLSSPVQRDSVMIEDIDPFTGPKSPSGSKLMTGMFNLSYTVKVLYK